MPKKIKLKIGKQTIKIPRKLAAKLLWALNDAVEEVLDEGATTRDIPPIDVGTYSFKTVPLDMPAPTGDGFPPSPSGVLAVEFLPDAPSAPSPRGMVYRPDEDWRNCVKGFDPDMPEDTLIMVSDEDARNFAVQHALMNGALPSISAEFTASIENAEDSQK
jgi:hypothetical protein